MEKHNTHVTNVKNEHDSAVAQRRTAFMAGICISYLKDLMDCRSLPPAVNRNVVRQAKEQLERFVREIRRTVPPHDETYLDKILKRDKLLDTGILIDACARIGVEEDERPYDEFFGMVIDCIDAIFYAQQNRRKMHFSKYRALFKLFEAEIRRDVNDQPGQIIYNKDTHSLFLRTAPPVQTPQIR